MHVTDRLPAGLAGVPVAETTIGDVRGDEGFYHYRQYDAVELAGHASVEQVWALLFDGSLPDARRTEELRVRVGGARVLPVAVTAVLPAIAEAQGTGLGALRTGVSLLAGARGVGPMLDLSTTQRRDEALDVVGAIPTLIAALHALARGGRPAEPDPEAGHAQDYLRMLLGCTPSPDAVRALEIYLVTTIDHGFNASTFAGRVIASTGADIGGVLAGALAALSGPLHGGAPGRVLDMLDELTSAVDPRDHPALDAATTAWVSRALERGERIMGFGHRVYRTVDPRATRLRQVLERLGGPQVAAARVVEEAVLRRLEARRPGRRLRTNVEFYAGVLMSAIGIPRELFTPTFAVSRAIGWAAHALEQAGSRTIIRPSAIYTGPPAPAPLPQHS